MGSGQRVLNFMGAEGHSSRTPQWWTPLPVHHARHQAQEEGDRPDLVGEPACRSQHGGHGGEAHGGVRGHGRFADSDPKCEATNKEHEKGPGRDSGAKKDG